MRYETLSTAALAVVIAVGFAATASVQAQAQTRHTIPYAGSVDAWQHGYEHAYRDGTDQGRQDRERKMPYSWKNNDYWGMRGYERAFGDQNQYMEGYRSGYQAGYDDGYYGLPGQYGQLYGRPQAGARVAPQADPYANRPYSSTDMAFDAGYREGVTLGQQDRGRNSRSNYRNNAAYQNADLGYRSTYGDKRQYQTQYRDGIDRGYADGFGRAQYNGVGANNGGYAPRGGGRTVGTTGTAADGTFTVAANRQWTPTGIRVVQGETLRFTSTGEILFSGNANDRAGVAGSPAHKFVAGSPLPNALAGALIGRIDNGLPFGIGDQTTIVVPASGLLYLGTNDDVVTDNSGQFTVVISFVR